MNFNEKKKRKKEMNEKLRKNQEGALPALLVSQLLSAL